MIIRALEETDLRFVHNLNNSIQSCLIGLKNLTNP